MQGASRKGKPITKTQRRKTRSKKQWSIAGVIERRTPGGSKPIGGGGIRKKE